MRDFYLRNRTVWFLGNLANRPLHSCDTERDDLYSREGNGCSVLQFCSLAVKFAWKSNVFSKSF